MNERAYGAEYYGRLRERLRDLLVALDGRLPLDDRRLVAELVEANECGLALLTIGDALAEESIPVDDAVSKEIIDLAGEMGLSSEVADGLHPASIG